MKKVFCSLVIVALTGCTTPGTSTNTNSSVNNGLVVNYNAGDTSSSITSSTGTNLSIDRLGRANRSINFNGANQSIKINVPASKSVGVSLWFKAPYNEKSYPTLFSYGEENFHAHLFGGTVYADKTGGIGNYAYTSKEQDKLNTRIAIEDVKNYFDSKWHHLYSTYDREKNKMQLFIDNSLRAERDINLDLLSSTYVEIGHASSTATNDTWFKGEMSDIKIYNRGLTSGEVTLLHNEGR